MTNVIGIPGGIGTMLWRQHKFLRQRVTRDMGYVNSCILSFKFVKWIFIMWCIWTNLWTRKMVTGWRSQGVSWLGKIGFGEKRKWASKEIRKGKVTEITKRGGDGNPWDKCYVIYLSFIMPWFFYLSMVIELCALFFFLERVCITVMETQVIKKQVW